MDEIELIKTETFPILDIRLPSGFYKLLSNSTYKQYGRKHVPIIIPYSDELAQHLFETNNGKRWGLVKNFAPVYISSSSTSSSTDDKILLSEVPCELTDQKCTDWRLRVTHMCVEIGWDEYDKNGLGKVIKNMKRTACDFCKVHPTWPEMARYRINKCKDCRLLSKQLNKEITTQIQSPGKFIVIWYNREYTWPRNQ